MTPSAVTEKPSQGGHTNLAVSLMLPTNGSTRIWRKKKSRASIRQTNHAAWDLCKEKSLCSGLRIGVNQPHTIARGRFTCCVLILLIIAASQPLGADTRAWVRHRVCLRASKVIYTVSSVPGASALSLMQTK